MIRKCNRLDESAIFTIVNESAKAYKGVIPDDRYHEPYMPLEELRREMKEMTFFGCEDDGRLIGVAGYQPVRDITLVRHTYVLSEYQRRGVGTMLLDHIKSMTTTRQLLVGTWKTANWAIRFYEKNGFKLMPKNDELLRRYWRISERQIELSVVLGETLAETIYKESG